MTEREKYLWGFGILVAVALLVLLALYLIREEECKKSKHGCCPDNKTAKVDSDGCNCFGSKCDDEVKVCVQNLKSDLASATSKIQPIEVHPMKNFKACMMDARSKCLKACGDKDPKNPSDKCIRCCTKKCFIEDDPAYRAASHPGHLSV